MIKLVRRGITIEINPADAQRYLNAGYTRLIEKPVEKPATVINKKAKAGKEKPINGDT